MAEKKLYNINIKNKRALTPEIIGSYVAVLEPKPLMDSDKEAWGMQLRLKKGDPGIDEFVKALRGIYAQVLIDKFGKEKARQMAKVYTLPMRDGDSEVELEKDLKGYWFMSANNHNRAPTIVGSSGKTIDPDTLTDDDIYSGAKYRCLLEFYVPKNPKNKRVCVALTGIMKTGDGERLDGQMSQDQISGEFDDFASDAADMFQAAGAGLEDEATPNNAAVDALEEDEDFDFS